MHMHVAGAKHLIVVPDDERPWSLLFEIADVTTPGEWVLVGGLMVHAHALRAHALAHACNCISVYVVGGMHLQ